LIVTIVAEILKCLAKYCITNQEGAHDPKDYSAKSKKSGIFYPNIVQIRLLVPP